ncbi:unnamed protein product [marine sediment metagenome]|uniref:Methyltransferase FkbM domain-containing protein n=1 Tax=marine sediment metagenome TaxID=412755 RepID=X0V5M7_9ZZZZ
MNHGSRFDKYICYDVFDENLEACKENTSELTVPVEVHKRAVWSSSDEEIDFYAYEPWDTKDIHHFGACGNISCVEYEGEQGDNYKVENKISSVKTICLDSIIQEYGPINLLKIDVEGSEYPFLIGKDLSSVNYIVGEMHMENFKKIELIKWLNNTNHFNPLHWGNLPPLQTNLTT